MKWLTFLRHHPPFAWDANLRYIKSTETRLFLLCSFLSMGGFLFGYNLVTMAGVLIMPNFIEYFNIVKGVDVYIIILITMVLGAFAGSLLAGPLADYLGRRGLTLVASLICMLGSLLLVSADELAKIYAGRTITGISVGMLSMVVPLYITELAPPSLRGRLIAINQLCIMLGISAAFWITFACTSLTTSRSWRIPLGVDLVPNVIYTVGLFFVPQSPRFSIQNNRDDEAIGTLATIRGDGSTQHRDVVIEFAEIKQTIRFENRRRKQGYRALFSGGSDNNIRRLIMATAVQAFQQLMGAVTLMMYSPIIFQATELRGHVATLFANAISGSVILVATLAPLFFIDRWHRRRAMITGALICAVLMAVMSAVFAISGSRFDGLSSFYDTVATGPNTDLFIQQPRASTIAFFVFFYLFLASYGCFWGPLGWIYPAELFSNGVRSKGLSISTSSHWFFKFGTTVLTPIAFESIQWRVFVIYCVFCTCIAIVVYFCFPETKGLSLEEIDLLFSAGRKFYDPRVHHPQSASDTLAQIEQRYIERSPADEFDSNYPLPTHPPVTPNAVERQSPML